LHKIATQHYGNRSTSVVNAIYQANRSVLSSPNVLHVGVELTLPPMDGVHGASAGGKPAEEKRTAAPPEKPAPRPEAAGPLPRWYQVRKNDRYVSIAREQLGDAARWREIHQLNKDKFPDPQRIREGVRIKLPGTAVASAGGGRP
jgi:nucleoid-associated protein YgaU